MSLRPTKIVGLIFLALAIALFATWDVWISTRTEVPVDIPVAMAVGHVHTPEFKVNLSTTYIVEIEVKKTIPFDTLNCLLGLGMMTMSSDLQECPDRPSVVKASWTLTSGGRLVASGSSDDHRYGGWGNDSISRELGRFHSESGSKYALDVDVLSDGSALAPGKPRLKVEVHPEVYEGDAVWSFFVFSAGGILVLIGALLLIVSYLRNRRRQPSPTAASL